MSSRAWLFVGVALVVWCCCCSNRGQQTGPPSTPAEIAAFAFAPETEMERTRANEYAETVLVVLRRELPSLTLLDTRVHDWCEPYTCHLGVDYFFGLDGELLPALESIDKVLRRDSLSVEVGVDSVRSGSPECFELRYGLRKPEGTTSGDPRWMSAVHWIDLTGAGCPGEIPPVVSAGGGGLIYHVRDKRVDMGALEAGALGKHRYLVHVGIGGLYGGRNL